MYEVVPFLIIGLITIVLLLYQKAEEFHEERFVYVEVEINQQIQALNKPIRTDLTFYRTAFDVLGPCRMIREKIVDGFALFYLMVPKGTKIAVDISDPRMVSMRLLVMTADQHEFRAMYHYENSKNRDLVIVN